QIDDAPVPPSRKSGSRRISAPLDAVVLKALAKDRQARFQSMKELALALCAATGEDPKLIWGTRGGGEPILTAPEAPLTVAASPSSRGPTRSKQSGSSPTPLSRRRPLMMVAGGLSVLVVIAGVVVLARSPAPEPAPAPPVAVVAAPPPPAPAPAEP